MAAGEPENAQSYLENDSNLTPHSVFWLEDGSVVVPVQDTLFRVNRSLLFRHSQVLPTLKFLPPNTHQNYGDNVSVIDLPKELSKHLRAIDVQRLMEYLYHDLILTNSTPFQTLASLLRISSPKQFGFPFLFAHVLAQVKSMFQPSLSGLMPFHVINDAERETNLIETLLLARECELHEIETGILYNLVATSHFETQEESTPPQPSLPDSPLEKLSTDTAAGLNPDSRSQTSLSVADAEICSNLMNQLITYFTPILFTPAATPHMACTDVFAEKWMNHVIQPSLENGGVYRPLETLESMRNIDWASEGLCNSCTAEKREEWRAQQLELWRLMDGWISDSKLVPAALA